MIGDDTTTVQGRLWSAVRGFADSNPTPIAALVVNGMNDVLNSQGMTQAAWWNRLPLGAWSLMSIIAICSTFLLGYGARRKGELFFLVLPLTLSLSFFLIADIDSPRSGIIRVLPQNLNALAL